MDDFNETLIAAANAARTTAQRFEIKYVISEAVAQAISAHIAPYVVPDPAGAQYSVVSVYLDTPDLDLYWRSFVGECHRYKLRIRSYDDNEEGMDPLFLEVKQRINQITRKTRVAILREKLDEVIADRNAPDECLCRRGDPAAAAHANRFCEMMAFLAATPRVAVKYRREPFVSRVDHEPLRITFDRRLACAADTSSVWNGCAPWRELPEVPVVLEIKFTDCYPAWVERLARQFDLRQESFSKYVYCVDALRREGFALAGNANNRMDTPEICMREFT